jgi:hypothetical protein
MRCLLAQTTRRNESSQGVPAHCLSPASFGSPSVFSIRRHLQLAIRNDEELDRLFKGITISNGGACRCLTRGNVSVLFSTGVLPYIHADLMPKKTKADVEEVSSGGKGKGKAAIKSSKGK